jgi:hypothetical protein
MGSLLDSINDSASPDLIRSIAATTGESLEGVKKGLTIAAATIIGTLAGKSSDSGFSNQVVALVNSYGAGSAGVATAATAETSSRFLNLLFGGHKAAVETKVSQAAGLTSISGAALLSAAAPLVSGALASKLDGGAAGLSSALGAELPSVRHLIPPGVPGVSLPDSAGIARAAVQEKDGGDWLWPVLVLGAVLIGALVWYFHRGQPL